MIRWFLIIVAGLITLYALYWGAFLLWTLFSADGQEMVAAQGQPRVGRPGHDRRTTQSERDLDPRVVRKGCRGGRAFDGRLRMTIGASWSALGLRGNGRSHERDAFLLAAGLPTPQVWTGDLHAFHGAAPPAGPDFAINFSIL